MNKIIIANDEITLKQVDRALKVDVLEMSEFLNVKSMKIDVLENTELEIEYANEKETKFEITINIGDNISFNLYELKKEGIYKMFYNYNVGENSLVFITKIHDTLGIKEKTKININGNNSKVIHELKTISKKEEKYDFAFYHNAKNTFSNIINKGVNIKDGTLIFNLSSFAKEKMIGSDINQNSRIINLTNKTCQINPNLFIDEEDVCANHSAYISKFSKEELFYLMSRGINKNSAERLLIKGFLYDEKNEKLLEKLVNKYWR